MIKNGDLVTFRYSIKDPDGSVIDSSGDALVSHICGAHTLVPGLERALVGRAPGQQFAIQVAPAYGFGERVDNESQITVKRTELPADMRLEAGMIVMLEDAAGEPMPMWLVGLTDDTAIFDCNHPLAGVTLHFDVEITDCRPATADEKLRNFMGVSP